MEVNNTVFDSTFVIDGIKMGATPAKLLAECVVEPVEVRGNGLEIIDETVDPTPSVKKFNIDLLEDYIGKIRSSVPRFALPYPEKAARAAVAEALTECIFNGGHFRLQDIDLTLAWKWDCDGMGNMASFYRSVESAAQYMWDLGVKVSNFVCYKDKYCSMECEPDADDLNPGDAIPTETPDHIAMVDEWRMPSKARDAPTSWILYIPFDTCPYRLGGSAFSRFFGNGGDPAPEISDPDYFMDCFEVVREMVEDGVAIKVNGKAISAAEKPRTIVLYKPVGVLSTMSDPFGGKTVAELVR
ncbi:MAG: hypothetical protein MJY56_05185, partial [Bacteroidales bacterium]|nr:hypothetical protein [Bacteroidales bacterium]